jgi:hypothetical protein
MGTSDVLEEPRKSECSVTCRARRGLRQRYGNVGACQVRNSDTLPLALRAALIGPTRCRCAEEALELVGWAKPVAGPTIIGLTAPGTPEILPAHDNVPIPVHLPPVSRLRGSLPCSTLVLIAAIYPAVAA